MPCDASASPLRRVLAANLGKHREQQMRHSRDDSFSCLVCSGMLHFVMSRMVELTTEVDHHLLLVRVAPLDVRTQLTHLSSEELFSPSSCPPQQKRPRASSPQNSKRRGSRRTKKTTKSYSTRLLQFRVQLVDGVEDLIRIGGEQRQKTMKTARAVRA